MLLMSAIIAGCDSPPDQSTASDDAANPAAPGFNAAESDPEAIALADRVMATMGGRDAWDATRYIGWRFFGVREHLWDKHENIDRIDYTDRDGANWVVIVDLDTKEGLVFQNGERIDDPALERETLERGYEMWINDSYWLVMPYKLKDTGVTLRRLGDGALSDGRPAKKLELTFEGVGVTPQNKYEVLVASDTGLVEEWSYFANATDAEPRMTTPWEDWGWYGEIMLAPGRGERDHTKVGVYESVPATAWTHPEPVALNPNDGG